MLEYFDKDFKNLAKLQNAPAEAKGRCKKAFCFLTSAGVVTIIGSCSMQ